MSVRFLFIQLPMRLVCLALAYG